MLNISKEFAMYTKLLTHHFHTRNYHEITLKKEFEFMTINIKKYVYLSLNLISLYIYNKKNY